MNRTLAIAAVCLLAAASEVWAANVPPPTTQPAPVVTPPVASAPATMIAPATSPAETQPASAPDTKPAVEPTPATNPVEPPTATKEPLPPPTTKAAEPPKPPAKKLDAFAHGKTITAVPDQDIIVELKGTTDTPWTLAKTDGTSLQQVGKVEFKPKKEGDKEGVYTTTLKSVKEGKTTVQLERLVEAGKKDKMEVKFTVVVAAN